MLYVLYEQRPDTTVEGIVVTDSFASLADWLDEYPLSFGYNIKASLFQLTKDVPPGTYSLGSLANQTLFLAVCCRVSVKWCKSVRLMYPVESGSVDKPPITNVDGNPEWN